MRSYRFVELVKFVLSQVPKQGISTPASKDRSPGTRDLGPPSICGRDVPRPRMLQALDFAQQLRCFVFKLRPLRDKIFFRVFAGAELEVQVAEIFVELVFALEE